MNAYLSNRCGSSQSFFKRVESLIPKFSSSEKVPEVSNINATIVEAKPKRRPFFWFLFSSSTNKEFDEEEIEEISHVEEEIEKIDEQEDKYEEDIQELEEKRKGLLKRLFSFLFSDNNSQEDYEYEEEFSGDDAQEDSASVIREQETRATLKMIHKWIGRLPPEQIDAFKRSPDFQKYKDLLEMYNLIK